MDQIVQRSMLKWPNVPAVYGWLRLDRRGNWLVKMPSGPGMPNRYERIRNAVVTDFIGRNYARDESGRYFFQNGPQRVYVACDYTPYVFRLDDAGTGFAAQNGEPAAGLTRMMLDESGALLLECRPDVGVVLDRDLAKVIEAVRDSVADEEELFAAVQGGEARRIRICGQDLELAPVLSAEVPRRYGYVPHPAPPPGEREC